MDNANKEVQVGANFVTDSNEEEGFAHAIEKFVLIRSSIFVDFVSYAAIPLDRSDKERVSDSGDALWKGFADKPFNSLSLSAGEKHLISGYFFFRHQPCIDRVIFLAVPHRGSRLAAGIVGSIGSRLIGRSKTAAEALKELAAKNPGVLNHYFASVSARGGPTSLFSLAPNPLLDRLAALPIAVPFHSIIGDRDLTAELEVPTGSWRTAART